jgi:3-hydroxy acid dehydrogenase/malonic semialdehyde reductase
MVESSLYKTRDIKGKRALVTGASAGIGRTASLLLAEQGCSLVLVARRPEKLEEVKSEILSLFPSCQVRTEVCDVSEIASVDALLHRINGFQIDILVNNAGLALGVEPGDRMNLNDTERMVNTNLVGAIALVTGIAPQMRSRNAGDIVNISSVAGTDHYAGGAIYCATKAALDAYSDCLRMDLVDTDIRVIIINPGLVSGTEFSFVRFNGDSEKAAQPYQGINCLTAMDIADQIVYALTRPNNVQIAQIKSYCNQQGHAKYVFSRK